MEGEGDTVALGVAAQGFGLEVGDWRGADLPIVD